MELRMVIDGPFSLAAAAAFGFGPSTGRPYPGEDVMRLAFVTDDLQHQVGVLLSQEPGGDLIAEVSGASDIAAVGHQIRRILSVDRPAEGWVAAGQRDPVLGGLQAAHPGLRPVLFHSPYEAAAWAMLSQRRHRTQAAALRRNLSAETGQAFELAGETEYAFPLPERLLDLKEFPGLEPQRVERLHGVARAARPRDDPSPRRTLAPLPHLGRGPDPRRRRPGQPPLAVAR
jgi:DNA-3-methyladenine glycosylase II